MMAAEESSDVADFLKTVKLLNEERDSEEEEKNRKLEESIRAEREKRQSRRERARSISPTKSSPGTTPTLSRVSTTQSSNLAPALASPKSIAERDSSNSNATPSTSTPESPQKEVMEGNTTDVGSAQPSPSNAMPQRKPTLSWQQRPSSQGPRSRPLSMVNLATENAARSSPRGTPEVKSPVEPTLTRDQIAQSLASKDPAWFRQTADRGLNSPAYRRNQVEDEDRADHTSNSARVQMPGMSSRDAPDKVVENIIERPSSRSSALGSPMPITGAQRFEPPNIEIHPEARSTSPTRGRMSPDRPVSPTKGMGGFVQSAIMKRADSVKRWSVVSPPGLNRSNSVASNRNSHDPNTSTGGVDTTSDTPKANFPSREGSPRPISRPTSSHSSAAVIRDGHLPTSTRAGIPDGDVFSKPALPASRSQTPQNIKASPEIETTPPSSPTKTMDTRRWSPTKASWLEMALNKPPDSPKPKPAPPPQQPSWMSEINKAKQKGSVDMGRNQASAPKHEVNIGGLMRSPPPGGLPAGFSSRLSPKIRSDSVGSIGGMMSPGAAPKGRSESVSSLLSPGREELPKLTSPTSAVGLKTSPGLAKVKPDTPPKKDFRASLKSRPVPKTSGSDEPEFKNVFGQLRSTKTQNYVAPDELKSNITRGKAALAVTGGPKKTERVDEFKDAILKKKEDFKKTQLEGKGVTRDANGTTQEAKIPEALAKRQALGRSNTLTSESNPALTALSSQQPPKATIPAKEASAPGRLQGKEAIGSKLAGRFNPALAGLLARGPPSMGSETSRSSSSTSSQRTVSMSTSTSADTSEQGPQLTHMTKGRARGPRRKAPSAVPASNPSSELVTQAPEKSVPPPPVAIVTSQKDLSIADQQPKTIDEAPTSQPSSPRKLDMKRRSQFLREAPKDILLESPKPLSPTKKANTPEILKPEQSQSPTTSIPAIEAKSPILIAKAFRQSSDTMETTKSSTLPLSPKKTNVGDLSPRESPTKSPEKQSFSVSQAIKDHPSAVYSKEASANDTRPRSPITEKQNTQTSNGTMSPPASVRNTAAMWAQPSPTQAIPPRVRSPIKLPTHDDEKAAMVGAGLRPASPLKVAEGLGIQTDSTRPLPTPPLKRLTSPPPAARFTPASSPTKAPSSPIPQTSEATGFVTRFFGTENSPPPHFSADTASILMQTSRADLVQTSRADLYHFIADGKKQPVPSHQERILFEENMYLCVHSFTKSGKKAIEVYLWVGDEVPISTAEGARVHAQKEAKSAGGKLIVIPQGKESAEFFQALGGIIIVRRGSSQKFDSLAPHILCGRKHFGQISFDEVDYSANSLCSGFPFLIATQSGKSYLWKGKGSGIDELSCARLIGMDFGLTGEIEEVDDGAEPESFIKMFGNIAEIPKSADHWRMKPNYTKYSGRLFCADSAARSQIVEIVPFTQLDLLPSNIYVLDAFFEIYVIVGAKAQSQYAAFHNALIFSQEYGILAAGMEDRPYVPVTTVVLEGIPKDMKSVFRKWKDDLAPTMITQTSPGLQRGRSLRVVPLTAALEATRRR